MVLLKLPGFISKFFGLLGAFKHKKTLGTEFAGEIVEIGSGVTKFSVGDEVYGTTTMEKYGGQAEFISIPEATAAAVQKTKALGGRVWAVGTTTVRSLEFAARRTGRLEAMSCSCDLYIYPGYEFKVIDNLITNFHLPDSSLLFLVAALCGRTTLLDCYATAVREGYRFFSYGDAMAIITV